MKKPAIVFIILAVLVGLWAARKIEQMQKAKIIGKAPAMAAKPGGEARLLDAPTPDQVYGDSPLVQSQLKVKALKQSVGFQGLPFKQNGSNWDLSIQIQSSFKQCEMGDLDLIRIDQKRRKVNSILLTLEDLVAKKVVATQKLDISKLPLSIKLQWKVSEKPRNLGLYICSDAKSSGSCNQSSVGEINRAIAKEMVDPQLDKTYYFQLIQEGSQLDLLDSSRQNASEKTKLQEVFAGNDMAEKEARPLSELVSRNLQLLGSAAARMEKGNLVIDLPQNDPSCPLPNLQF